MQLPAVRQMRDLLALVRYDLGYVPSSSLILLPRGPGHVLRGPVVRLDVELLRRAAATCACGCGEGVASAQPVLPAGVDAPALWVEVLAKLVSSGAQDAIVLVIADGLPPEDDDGVTMRLAAWAAAQLESTGVQVDDVALVRGERWAFVRIRECEPAGAGGDGRRGELVLDDWQETGDVASSPMAVAMIGAGRALAADRGALLPAGLPDPGRKLCTCPVSRSSRHWLELWQVRLEQSRADPRVELDLGELACLSRALTRPILRDAVLISAVQPDQKVATATLAWSRSQASSRGRTGGRTGGRRGRAAGRDPWPTVFDEALARPVDHDHLAAAEGLLERVLASRPAHDPVEILAMLGWAAWWSGRGARACVLVDEVLRRRPGHRLATITAGLVDGLVAPPWAEAAGWS